MSKPVRSEQKAATRKRFLQVARKVFARHGYDQTSIGMICRAAGVTHGALYHHFASKTVLFAAVLEELFLDVGAQVLAAAEGARGWKQIEAASDAYLDACADPVVQAILLRDGPRVLPPEVFDTVDREANEPLVAGLLKAWIEAGLLKAMPVELFARVIGGAYAEAGAAIAEAEDPARVRRELRGIFRAWFEAMKA